MSWILILEIAYVLVLVLVCLQIVYDTTSTNKTLAYLLLVIFIPVIGMFFYFSFGINYRKRRIFSRKLIDDDALRMKLIREIILKSELNLKNNSHIGDAKGLVHLLLRDTISPLTTGNAVCLLQNGEEKFPEVMRALHSATHHIHIEYYIFENDAIGNEIKSILIKKAAEGVKVRLIYDAFGSRSLKRRFLQQLRNGGVEVFPFNRIHFRPLANRLNYRNHRKIIVIDGHVGFVGGMNISDRYINKDKGVATHRGNKDQLYWRDTHLRIDGPGVQYLQYLFFCDWNFCSKQKLQPNEAYFDLRKSAKGNENVQIAASGPDSPLSTIMLSQLKAITLARKEILITTPYFIPGESILNALKVAALGGVAVRIIAPGISDSRLVNAAAWSYFDDLLRAGVEIYLYRKGFIHVKTMVVDDQISIVGTANMDFRSFDLNFEVNAVVYGDKLAGDLRASFFNDISDSEQIDPDAWRERPKHKQLPEKIARLLSPLL